jgi:hypothetical protein
MDLINTLRVNLRRLNSDQLDKCYEMIVQELARRDTNSQNLKVMK